MIFSIFRVKFYTRDKKYFDFVELNNLECQKMVNQGHVLQPEKIKGFFGSDFLNNNGLF